MCEHCGCGLPPAGETHTHGSDTRVRVDLMQSLLDTNRAQAEENRRHLMDHRVYGVNIMSSPGAGKTTLLEAIVRQAKGRFRIGALEGDVATERDAERLRTLGIPVHSLTTGSTCHLDAKLVHAGLHVLPLDDIDLLFVENVGNLICPGLYDLGCHLNGVLLSVTEGDDKVAKYPQVFRFSQFLSITKVDLLPHVAFDPEQPEREARILKGDIRCHRTSAVSGEGVDALLEYLLRECEAAYGTASP